MDKRTVELALHEERGPVTTSGKFVRKPEGRWDEALPAEQQEHARKGKAAAQSRERQRRSMGRGKRK